MALTCPGPVAGGLHITHRSSEDLARQAVKDGAIAAIGARAVRRILHEVDLQPHRTRCWKTGRLDDRFEERAEEVLWCRADAARPARRRIWVACADEAPNFQASERTPIRRPVPGRIERRGFEYTRHGTVDILVFLVVHTGQMESSSMEMTAIGLRRRSMCRSGTGEPVRAMWQPERARSE